MKTKETLQMEHDIRAATRKIGVFGCFEVTIGIGGKERVDFMTYEPRTGLFRCYEIKAAEADFHSSAAVSFVGGYNYYVLTKDLYAKVEKEIPDWAGVYVHMDCVKKPKRRDIPDTKEYSVRRSVCGRSTKIAIPFRQVLMESMMRSLYRDSDKLIQAGNEQYVNRLRTEIEKSREREWQTRAEYNRFFTKAAERYGYDAAWEMRKEAESWEK